MINARFLLLLASLSPLVLARCDCADPIVGLPVAQIEVRDDAGNSHVDANPWLTVNYGDADSGQSVVRPLTVANTGNAPLSITSVCVVNAADVETAKAAPCIVGQTTAFTFASLAGSEIKKGESAEMSVTFAPLAGGPAQLFIQIVSNAEKEPVVAVELVGRGTDGRLCVEPVTGVFDFGDVEIGVTAPGQMTVSNCGVKPVTIESFDFAQNPDNAFIFTAQGGDPVGRTLAEGEAIVLDVTFTPQQPGPYRDTRAGIIRILTGAPFAAQYDLLLVGNGIVPPSCKVNVVPEVLQFNAVASGESSTRQLIIQSVGQCGCTVDAISDPTPGDAGFVLGTVPALPFVLKGTTGCDDDPAGADAAPTNITVDVVYTSPVQDTPVTYNATMDVSTSDLIEPVQTVNLEATGGGAPFCQLNVTPTSSATSQFDIGTPGRTGLVEFGRTSVHVPKRLPITLTNIGNTDCTVSSVTYDEEENTLTNEFSLETVDGAPGVNLPSFAVSPGETVTFFAVFSPTHTIESNSPFAFGKYSGAKVENLCGFLSPNTRCNGVTFVTNDTVTPVNEDNASELPQGTFSIGFEGTPVEPDVDVIPGELDFGLVTVGCGSPEQRVTVYNNGGADLVVGQPFVDPAGTVFVVEGTTAPSFPHSIPPGGSMAINVRYYASAPPTLETANLLIPTTEGGSDGPPVLVPLRGEGTTDNSQVDIFDQLNDPKVDVLWVIDDSGSMAPFQQQLAANFDEFFVDSNIDSADYHIAVTTTLWAQGAATPPSCSVDADCGAGGQCVIGLCTAGSAVNSLPDDPMAGWYTSCAGASERFITPTSPDAEGSFECNTQVSDPSNVNPDRPASDSAEGGLRAAYKFLSPPNITDPTINGGFLRDDAKLHIIFVEDEPEQSKGGIQQYIDFFKNVKGFRNEGLVAVSAIAAPPEGCTYTDPSGAQVALQDDRYDAVVEEMNGRFQSICNDDWSGMMSQLGLDSLGLRVEFFLTRAATAETIDVCVRATGPASTCVDAGNPTSEGAANGWFYDSVSNSVVFNPGSVPPRGSRIEVSYNAFCF